MNLLILFVVLNILNVIIQTAKSLLTIKGNKWVASISNAVAYAFYTVVLVYTMSDLPLVTKCVVVGLCNLIGVFVVKIIEEKMRKDKLWEIKLTIKKGAEKEMIKDLKEKKVSFNYIDINKYILFNCYAPTQTETAIIKRIAGKYNAKCFANESKIM